MTTITEEQSQKIIREIVRQHLPQIQWFDAEQSLYLASNALPQLTDVDQFRQKVTATLRIWFAE